MKIKNFVKYFKERVLKYFKISVKFQIFQSEIFHCASLLNSTHSDRNLGFEKLTRHSF